MTSQGSIAADGPAQLDGAQPLPWSAWSYLVLAATAVGMPTGSLLGFNVKWALLGITTALVILESRLQLGPRQVRALAGAGAAALVVVAFATASLLMGNDSELALAQAKEFVTVIVLVALGLLIFRRDDRDADRVIHALAIGAGLFSVLKLLTAAAILAGALAFSDVVALTEGIFGQTAAGLEVEGSLVRIQMGNDFAMTYVLYFALARSWARTWPRRLVLVALAVSIVVSLSRFLWFATAIAVLVVWARTLRRRLWLSLAVALAGVTTVVWLATATEVGQATIEARFKSGTSESGDQIRVEQRNVLLDEIEARPLFGKGLGTYSGHLIRKEDAPYSYENQWLALLMQLGAFGMVVLLVYPAVVARGLLRGRSLAAGLPDTIMLGIFLLQGFFNPNLTSSTSAAVLLVFVLLGRDADTR